MKHTYLALAGAVAIISVNGAAPAAPTSKAKPKQASAMAAETDKAQPKFAPVPSWVAEQAVPRNNPKNKDNAFELLLTNSQEYLTPGGLENFVEYVVEPLTQAGLQAFGNIALPWNIYRTDFTFHRVEIERDGKTIDALDRDNISVIRRETKLEQATISGLRTVLMPVKGLRVGDKLRVSFSYKTTDRIGKTEEIQEMSPPVSMGRMVRRFVVSKDLPVRWASNSEIKPVIKELGTTSERLFVAENFEPPKERKFVPDRIAQKILQVSSYNDWSEVAAPMAPLFDASRQTAPNSEVAQLADKIAAVHKDPHDRLIAALRESQDQVRYVALLLNDGDYSPMTADEVWEQRFGDCKGKTVFLLALLDRMGIQAEPMLVSVKMDDGLDQRLPSLAMFDHVIVRAHIGSETYFLDGTNYGQRTLEELKQAPTMNGLPLVQNAKLVKNPDVLPSAPLTEAFLTWDARNGVTAETPFEVTLILRGQNAADMRIEAATSTDREKLIESLKNKVPGISNDELEFVSSEPEAADGSYIARFKGSTTLDWSPVDGLKGNRLQLTQAPLVWDGEFDRDDDAGKKIPVRMAFPYWERTVEKVLLPNGGKDFVLDASTIDQTVAATHLTRSVTMADGVVTATNDFRRLTRELDGESARNAKEPLGKISDDYAYVVSRKKLKVAADR